MVLNQAQAEAVYSAMCALNNVGGILHARMPAYTDSPAIAHVQERIGGGVQVWTGDEVGNPGGQLEDYDSQADFAIAYGLDHGGEPQSAVAAAAGGLTQTACEY